MKEEELESRLEMNLDKIEQTARNLINDLNKENLITITSFAGQKIIQLNGN